MRSEEQGYETLPKKIGSGGAKAGRTINPAENDNKMEILGEVGEKYKYLLHSF